VRTVQKVEKILGPARDLSYDVENSGLARYHVLVAAPASLGGSLQDHGVRMTRQRKLLFELIDGSGEHLNAEALYQLAKKRDARINRVTVYRTLKLLKQEGLVDELDLLHHEGDQHYYETRLKREHAHVVCLRCGRVEEFFGEPLKRLKQQIETHFGFQIMIARTEVGGYCADCQRMAAHEAAALRNGPIPGTRDNKIRKNK
jgi:Fur family ferric uptake transcriptional regulator